MVKIGYAVHQEQYPPAELLEYAVRAEKADFDTIWTSDHFHPWVHSNSQCGFAWAWIASAAERTRVAPIGTGVTCPILRYNPAIVAQAFATLGSMYPNRIFLGVGTGEALNEMPVGCEWPSFKERAERIEEAVKVINALWTSERVTFKGKYYSLRKATLYTKPEKKVPLYLAGDGRTMARIAGRYADGFITSGAHPDEHLTRVLLPALEESARLADRDPSKIEKIAEVYASYADTFEKALASVRFWASTSLPKLWWNYPIYDPMEIEACGEQVGNDQLTKKWCISTEAEDHVKNLERLIRMGFNHVYVSGSSPNEAATIDFYAKKVLPCLRQ